MTHKHFQKGFTLIELAVVIVITGVLMGGAMALLSPTIRHSQLETTREKMDDISTALSFFAANYGRLPCPGDPRGQANGAVEPFGSPRGSGASGKDIAKTDCGAGTDPEHIGIVPFRALGLSEDQAMDGYGHFFTYAVSPTLTQYNADPTPPVIDQDISIASQCASPIWKTSKGDNISPSKAHVCCPLVVGNALNVVASKGSVNSTFSNPPPAQPPGSVTETWQQAWGPNNDYYTAGNYEYNDCMTDNVEVEQANCAADPTTPDCIMALKNTTFLKLHFPGWNGDANSVPRPFLDPSGSTTGGPTGTNVYSFCSTRTTIVGAAPPVPYQNFIAYVLISHGVNGDTAFIKNSAQLMPITAPANAEESQNRNAAGRTLTFVSEPISTAQNNNYFDDIVVWKTNDELISHFHNNSCVAP